ncbi:MAG: hypothetical protein FJX54_18420 [Alphaproteobacteria bacterium]|nr:hypothetical protein [Alphaproteobacteria bacterium]
MTFEGWETWDVALRCAGQLRLAPGAAIGLDLGACLAIGTALGYDVTALAELLPAAETGMITALNARLAAGSANPP